MIKNISSRCKGSNLLNHLRQTNKISDLSINYIYDKTNYGTEWMGILSFKHLGNKHQFIHESSQKRRSLNHILDKNYKFLFNIASNTLNA